MKIIFHVRKISILTCVCLNPIQIFILNFEFKEKSHALIVGLMNMNETGTIGFVRKNEIDIHKIDTSTLKSSKQSTILLLIVLGYLMSIYSNCSGQ